MDPGGAHDGTFNFSFTTTLLDGGTGDDVVQSLVRQLGNLPDFMFEGGGQRPTASQDSIDNLETEQAERARQTRHHATPPAVKTACHT